MAYFLAKTDPETYSIDDLEREDRTVWDGVTNAQAVRAIREMRPGDRIFVYHSGGVSGVVGLATVRSEAARRSEESEIGGGRPGIRRTAGPAHHAGGDQAIQAFDDWALVRQGRLSTMSAPEKFVEWMRKRYPGAGV